MGGRRVRSRGSLGGLILVLCCVISFLCPVVRVSSYGVREWVIEEFGVVVVVRLVAPSAVVTMQQVWFNESAEVVSIDTESPYFAQCVYIYNLSYFFQSPLGPWEFGTHSSSANMTVGSVRRKSHDMILSAAECGLFPGGSIGVTYQIGVDMGVEDRNGIIHRLNQVFEYPFLVVAGSDAQDNLNSRLKTGMNIAVGVIILAIIIGTSLLFRKRG